MSIWRHFRTTPCTSVGYTDEGGVREGGYVVGGPGVTGEVDVSTARLYGTRGLIRVWAYVEGEIDDCFQLTPATARDLAVSLNEAAEFCEEWLSS